MRYLFWLFFILTAVLVTACSGRGQFSDYDVVWHSQSRNSSESMPCGGGDIGMNVWVEDGDLLFYLARCGAFDENNTLLKSESYRPNRGGLRPFTADFRNWGGGTFTAQNQRLVYFPMLKSASRIRL